MPASPSGSTFPGRLRTLRVERGLTLPALAAKTGLSKGFLSQVERGMKAPSISSLLRISQVLGVTVGALFEPPARPEPAYSLVRRHQRQRYAREGSLYGYHYEALAFRKAIKRMEPFVVSPPLLTPRKSFTHEGDELLFVLSGRIQVSLDGELIQLRPGDCLYFEGSRPHWSRSLGTKARAIVVVSAPGT